MKVSIIVPVYNVSEYIVRCVESVINQTYQDIECILIDDYSPDDSIDLIKQRLESYEGTINFKIIHHDQNKGLSSARNTGTDAATGEYLYYLDSDDEITPNCIEMLITLVEKYPNVEMVQGNMQTIPEPKKQSDWRNILYKNYPEYKNDNEWIKNNFYTSNWMQAIPTNATNKLIKHKFVIENNLFFKEGIIHEDELWMFYAVKNMNTIAFTTKYTYIAYSRQGSIMRSGNNYKSIQSWYIILNEIFRNSTNPHLTYFKEKYIRILHSKMCLINLNSKESELYYSYKTLVKDIIKIFSEKKKITLLPLYILLMPHYFNKSFIGKKIFNLGCRTLHYF
ncbi:MAG: glycosyltransferase family 2 protein [Dysgonomonas sp.]